MRLRSRQLAKRLDSKQLLKLQSNNDSYWTADGEKGNMGVVRERGRTADDRVIKAELHPCHRGRATIHPSRLPRTGSCSHTSMHPCYCNLTLMHTGCRPILITRVDNYRFVCCWVVKPSSARCRFYLGIFAYLRCDELLWIAYVIFPYVYFLHLVVLVRLKVKTNII